MLKSNVVQVYHSLKLHTEMEKLPFRILYFESIFSKYIRQVLKLFDVLYAVKLIIFLNKIIFAFDKYDVLLFMFY